MWNQRHALGRILSGKKLPALDGLRMVAVLMVVTYHGALTWMPADLGVDAFFVLSGFLITWLLLGERERTGTVSLGDFYLRRAFRLLPAYYVYLGVAFTLYFLRHGERSDFVLPSLLYYANYFNAFHDHPATPISHTWSLAVEEQFYAFWALAFLLLSRGSRATVMKFLLVAIPAVVAWRSYLYLVVGTGSAYVYNAFDTRFDNIAIGCLAAVLTTKDGFLRGIEKISRHWGMPLATIGLIGLTHTFLPRDWHYSFGFTLYAMLIAIAILQLMILSPTRAWRWLNHPVARYIGTISYPMYLYHAFATNFARKLPHFKSDILMLIAATAATVLVGTISYYVVERPFLRLRNRLVAKAGSRPPSPNEGTGDEPVVLANQ